MYRLSILLLVAGFVSQAFAADVVIRALHERTDEPIAGAAICLGTSANPAQFGAYVAPRDGTVIFDAVPETPLVATVSKSGFRGKERMLRPGRHDRVLDVALARGGLGPVCVADKEYAPAIFPALEVVSFRINRGATSTRDRQVALQFSTSGKPSHFRVSEVADFSSAEWKSLEGDRTFTLSRSPGTKRLYIQVRKYSEMAGGSMEMLSEVASDTIELKR